MTYAVLAIAYFLVIGVFLVLSFFNFYHLIRFGMWSRFPIVMTVLYFVAIVGLLLVTQTFLADVDWSQPIEFSLPSLPSTNQLENILPIQP